MERQGRGGGGDNRTEETDRQRGRERQPNRQTDREKRRERKEGKTEQKRQTERLKERQEGGREREGVLGGPGQSKRNRDSMPHCMSSTQCLHSLFVDRQQRLTHFIFTQTDDRGMLSLRV